VETMHKRIKNNATIANMQQAKIQGGIKQRYTIQSRGEGKGFIATFNKVD